MRIHLKHFSSMTSPQGAVGCRQRQASRTSMRVLSLGYAFPSSWTLSCRSSSTSFILRLSFMFKLNKNTNFICVISDTRSLSQKISQIFLSAESPRCNHLGRKIVICIFSVQVCGIFGGFFLRTFKKHKCHHRQPCFNLVSFPRVGAIYKN